TRRSARTRERILVAAVGVFARRGFHGARVADIAEEAGIAYGLVYHHFRNKDEILAALFAERWSRYMRWLDEVAASPAPFAEKLLTGYVMGRLRRQGRDEYQQDEQQLVDLLLGGLAPRPG